MKTPIRKGMPPLLTVLLLAGCAAPAFRQPDVAVPAAFREAQAPVRTAADGTRWKQAEPAEQQPRGTWWLAFHDPVLDHGEDRHRERLGAVRDVLPAQGPEPLGVQPDPREHPHEERAH